jgi:hypothetical protein
MPGVAYTGHGRLTVGVLPRAEHGNAAGIVAVWNDQQGHDLPGEHDMTFVAVQPQAYDLLSDPKPHALRKHEPWDLTIEQARALVALVTEAITLAVTR